MWHKLVAVLSAPVFPGDKEKTRRARALHALHLNIGAALLILGSLGILFVFAEKTVTGLILIFGVLITMSSMVLNRRGHVKASGIVLLGALWAMTIVMSSLSGGVRSLDIIFFVSGTVVAGITLGASGAYAYAGLSLISGLGMVLIGEAGFVFLQIFTFPPVGAWVILFINLVFTVVPLQVALQSLSESALRTRLSEERYRLIASVMSDYAFSIQYGAHGEIVEQWLSGAFEAMTGYAPDEYFARGGWLSILHPEDQERDAQDMAPLHVNQKVSTEVRIIRKDQSVLWVRSYGHPLWNEKHNRLVGIYGAVQDITAQKRAEIELLQRAKDVSLLYRLGVALSGGQNLYQALRSFADELKQIIALDAFHIGLYDEQTDTFSYPLFLNLGEDIQPAPRKLRENPGLTYEVIKSRQTLYLADLTDPQTQRDHNILWVVKAPIRTYIGIPLTLQDQVIGIMSAQAVHVDAYIPDQIRLLETIAAQVAITIEKMSLLDQLQQELTERTRVDAELQQREAIMDVVADAANTFLKTSQWNDIVWQRDVHRLLERLGITINASHAYIFENSLDENDQVRMSLRYEWVAPGFKSDLENMRYQNVPLDEDYTGYWRNVITRGLPYIGDALHVPAEDAAGFQSRGYRAILDVPIYVDGIWWGTIGFDEMARSRNWSSAEVSALVVASNLLGAVIKRRQMDSALQTELGQRKTLIEELKQRNIESETLRESAAIVAATLDQAEAVERILEQLKRVVPYDSASVWLYQDQKAVVIGVKDLPYAATLPGEIILSDKEPDYVFWAKNAAFILIDDIQAEYPAFREPPLNYVHGWMAIPLRAREKLTGFIALDSRTIGKFTEHDAGLALTFANQVSIALENARLISDLQSELDERQKLVAELELRNAESVTLRESAAIVAATLDQSEAVARILEQLERVVHYNSASVQLLHGNMLEIVSSRGIDVNNAAIGIQFLLNEDEPSYPVIKSMVPYILYADVQVSIPAFNDIPHNNIHAWMAIPLKVKGQVVGIIALDGQQVGQFSERDAQLAVTYANQVAVALENARLFSELQEKFAERQKLIAELENKNAELERFTYTVSHDLRSPLVTIKGFLGYLERSASAGNMESFRKDMARIGSAADRMDNLLKDVLELSRIGRLVNTLQVVPFDDLVREAVEIVHGRLEARGITLHILSPLGTQPNLPLVNVDKPRLIEVLQNLIDNAAKYMGAQQTNPRIEIGTMTSDASGTQTFFVRDNGMGIAPEYHQRIFGLFDKLDATSDGTGIGLALVKRIIEFHGGTIWVESAVGQGSTFYFTLQG